MTSGLQPNKSTKNSFQNSRIRKWMPINSYIPYIRTQKPQEFKPEQALNCTNNSATYKTRPNLHHQKTEISLTTQLNKPKDLQFMDSDQQHFKLKKWQSKPLNYQPALNIWNTQMKKMERRIHSMENLLNDFKELDLKTKSLERQHHLEEAPTATEASVMDTEEELDIGVGIGHAANFFNQEEEAEVLLSPNNENIPLSNQQIQIS